MIFAKPRTARLTNPVLPLVVAALLTACASHPKLPPPTPARHTAPSSPPAPYPTTPPAPAAVQSGPLPGSMRDFVVNVGDRVYFDLNQYQVRPDARPILAAQASWLLRYPQVQVRIEGNCDELGTREYNFALGARRAGSVKDFLAEHGVNPSRITTISYGKERPIDLGTGEGANQHNRNAHTAITGGAS